MVTSLLPSLFNSNLPKLEMVSRLRRSSGVVRTAFFDTLDMQGDRIVGKETIPILLGEKRSLRLLKSILLILLAVLAPVGIFTGFGFWLLISPILMYFVLWAFERRKVQPGIRLEFLVESNIVLTGCLALLWSIMH